MIVPGVGGRRPSNRGPRRALPALGAIVVGQRHTANIAENARGIVQTRAGAAGKDVSQTENPAGGVAVARGSHRDLTWGTRSQEPVRWRPGPLRDVGLG